MAKGKAPNAKTVARNARCWARAQARHAENASTNELLHLEKDSNDGLGRRDLRRIAAGIRPAPDAEELLYIAKRPSRGKRRKVLKQERAMLAEAAASKTVHKERKKK